MEYDSILSRIQLQNILEHQNAESNRILATEAQRLAKDTEVLTYGSLKLAEKTKQETVSMRIITLVTLAFLPGTFISVCLLVSLTMGVLSMAELRPDTNEYRYHQIPIHRGRDFSKTCATEGDIFLSYGKPTSCFGNLLGMVWGVPMGNSQGEKHS